MSIKKMALFGVSVREKNSMDYWDVLVVADSIREARRLGVDACEAEGLITRTNIDNTLVFEKEAEVYQ
ncbi:MAG: hypothetical protein P1P78_10020 [Methyloprofundus sp.]|nr:hypothetical protein [Methyloprofundus sp.]